MDRITSAKNPVVKGLKALRERKGREAAGRFLVEGEVMLREALKCGLTLREALAEDDMNSAVTGDLSTWGDYVITTSNAPVKSGEMVRLADNS